MTAHYLLSSASGQVAKNSSFLLQTSVSVRTAQRRCSLSTAPRYIINVFMFCVRCCLYLLKFHYNWDASEQYSPNTTSTKFHDNLSSGSGILPCRKTHTTKPFLQLLCRASDYSFTSFGGQTTAKCRQSLNCSCSP